MKNNNTINNETQEKLKNAILVAARMSEPSAEQLAKERKECEEYAKLTGGMGKKIFRHGRWNWYKKLMDDLKISEEYYTGKGTTEFDIVESIFRLTEHEEKFTFGWCRSQRRCYDENEGRYVTQDNFYDECMKLITDTGLESEFNAWKEERQLYDCNGQVIRVGDTIRFPDITEFCGILVENGYETKVYVTNEGLVWIGYPHKAWISCENGHEILRIPGIPLTAEISNRAEVIFKREEGFVRYQILGNFAHPHVHMPASDEAEIFVKKS